DAAAVGLDYGAGDRQAEAGAVAVAGRVAAVEGVEDALVLARRDALAGVGDLDLHLRRPALRPHRDAAVGGGVADRVLDQVVEDALHLLRVGLGDDFVVGQLGGEVDAALLGRGAEGGDGVADQVTELDPAHRPGDVAGLDPGELEEVVDQVAEDGDVGADLAQVAVAVLTRDAVVDRLD